MTASITVSPTYITVKSTPTIPSNGNPLEAKGQFYLFTLTNKVTEKLTGL